MKNSVLFLFIILFTIVSCDKKKQTDKRISGNWNIESYTFNNFQGFITEYESSGQFYISNISNSIGEYKLDLVYSDGNSEYSKNENGTILINTDGESFMLNRTNPDGSEFLLDDGQIIFLNKSQLQARFIDETGAHEFVLSKD